MLVVAPLSARLAERFGTKLVVGTGLSFATVALLLFATLPATNISYVTDVLPRMVLIAIGMGLVMAPATESIMGSLPRAKAGVGSAMNDTTRQVGGESAGSPFPDRAFGRRSFEDRNSST